MLSWEPRWRFSTGYTGLKKSVHGAKLSTYRGGSREGSWVHAKMMPLFLGHYLAIQKGRTIKARKQPQRALGPVESPPGHPGLSSLIPSLPQASVCRRSPYLRWKRSQRTGMKDLCVEVVWLLTGVHSAKSRLPAVSDPSFVCQNDSPCSLHSRQMPPNRTPPVEDPGCLGPNPFSHSVELAFVLIFFFFFLSLSCVHCCIFSFVFETGSSSFVALAGLELVIFLL